MSNLPNVVLWRRSKRMRAGVNIKMAKIWRPICISRPNLELPLHTLTIEVAGIAKTNEFKQLQSPAKQIRIAEYCLQFDIYGKIAALANLILIQAG